MMLKMRVNIKLEGLTCARYVKSGGENQRKVMNITCLNLLNFNSSNNFYYQCQTKSVLENKVEHIRRVGRAWLRSCTEGFKRLGVKNRWRVMRGRITRGRS